MQNVNQAKLGTSARLYSGADLVSANMSVITPKMYFRVMFVAILLPMVSGKCRIICNMIHNLALFNFRETIGVCLNSPFPGETDTKFHYASEWNNVSKRYINLTNLFIMQNFSYLIRIDTRISKDIRELYLCFVKI